MKAASQHLTSLFRKSVRIRHGIMRHSSFPRTSPLHYYYITAESRCPCRKSRPKRRSAHHNFKRDTLHLNLHQCLCFRWMSGACDSISLESIWTWSIMVRKYTISGSSSIFCFLHFSNYFWFNFLQKNTRTHRHSTSGRSSSFCSCPDLLWSLGFHKGSWTSYGCQVLA